MEIADNFRVSTPIAATWKVLLDIEGIAPCLPGAQLQEVEGNEYRGIVKVKVGPITAQYKGTATLAEVDEAGRRIVIDATGRDTRGQGNATASIVVTMLDEGDGTRVDVVTDLAITGKVAQFGRGVLVDVSSKLMRQFVENLERDVLSNADLDTEPEPAPQPAASESAPAGVSGNGASGNGAAPSERRVIESREVEPIDLFDVAGESAAKRLVPLGVGLLVLFVLWRLLRGRD
jgi:carbon monoxide dehydrogenase subunit G